MPNKKVDDIYSGFESYGYVRDSEGLLDNDFVRNAIKTGYGQRRMQLPSLTKRSPLPQVKSSSLPPGSVAPLNTSYFSGEEIPAKNRPLTAVRAAGFSRDANKIKPSPNANIPEGSTWNSQFVLEETPREVSRKMELDIINLIEECSRDMEMGEKRMALQKAKKAVHKERLLVKHRDIQGMETNSFLDISFSARLNLAVLFEANDLPEDAINAYYEIIKNKSFPNAGKLRVNLGNLFFKLGRLSEAIKEYRRALDSISEEFNHVRSKILMNIGNIFVKMEQYTEAVSSYEHILKKNPNYKTTYHLILCYHALTDSERTKRAFQRLLATYPIGYSAQDSYTISDESSPSLHLLHTAIKTDSLHQLEERQQNEMERYILQSAQLIAPWIEENETAGFQWCVDTIKASPYREIACELEISKAMIMLRRNNFSDAAFALKHFEKQNPKIASHAANNLSFLYFLKGDLEEAEKYVNEAVRNDTYNHRAYVNKGNVLYARGLYKDALRFFNGALAIEADCIQAHYNLGLTLKALGDLRLAEKYFEKYNTIICGCPEALYQLGSILLARNDISEAINRFSEILSIVPNDPAVCAELSNIFRDQKDESSAFQYMFEAFKSVPANIPVLNWIARFFFQHKNYERAAQFFERAILVEPDESKWYLAIATCQLRSGMYQDAFSSYRAIHTKFPREITCLQLLVKLCQDMGMKELQQYQDKLTQLEEQIGEEETAVVEGGSSQFVPTPPSLPPRKSRRSLSKSKLRSRDRGETTANMPTRPKTRRLNRRISDPSTGSMSTRSSTVATASSSSFDMELGELVPGCSSGSSCPEDSN